MKTDLTIISLARMSTLASMLAGSAWAAPNMIGQQSQNEGLLVLPAPGKVTIDGDLSDWDWSGRIWVFADTAVRDRYSVEVAAMWDAENLYLAAKWKDPTPMFSVIDPAINPGDGWKADAWQMRILTDHPLWLTTWYYTARKQPVMQVSHWKNPRSERDGLDEALLMAKPGGTELGQGVEMAYRADADSKGFVQEIKIPWKVLYRQVPEIKADLVLRLGCEFQWGDVSGGKAPPVHRYADNMQPGKTDRLFFWSNPAAWGDARLVAKGQVPVRQYGDAAAESQRIEGSVPVCVSVPASAARFTVVIEDAQGNRVRNLAADLDPAPYMVAEQRGKRTVEVRWDGRDDAGALVKPGAYHVRGLTHEGLNAKYEMCFYNPGTPPWATADGSGAWGADHTGPSGVAAAGDWMAIGFPFAEGGSGTIGIAPDGRKKWGEKRGALRLAANDEYVFAVVGATMNDSGNAPRLCRYGKTDGAYRPFARDGKAMPFELPVDDIVGPGRHGPVTAIAANSKRIAVGVAAPEPQVPATIQLWVEGTLNASKPRDAWTLYVDDIRLTQVETPQGGKQTELVGPSVGNGDFENGNPDCYGYLVKELKVLTASPELPAASGHKFLAMTIDPQPSVPGHRVIKELGAPVLDQGRHFVLRAKVRAREPDGITHATASANFLDQTRGACGYFRGQTVAISPTDWTEVKLEFDYALPKEKQTTRLALADAQTAVPLGGFDLPSIAGLAYAKDGKLYGIVDGKVCAIDDQIGASTPLATPGLIQPTALAVDLDGNLVVADTGPDCQVKAFSRDGKLAYTCGRKGGRALRGLFDEQAMTHMSSVAVDGKGQVWVVEDWDYPRRVSVWGRDGRLVRDYIGNTGYSGTLCYLHEADPTLAYCGPMEFKLDKKHRSWKLTRILWVPDPKQSEAFPLWAHPHWFANPTFTMTQINGVKRDYLYFIGQYAKFHAVYMPAGDAWRPVAAITCVEELKRQLPDLDLKNRQANDGVFWNDLNGDGKVTLDECTFVPGGIPLGNSWGGRLDGQTLSIYADGLVAYKPLRISDKGVPVYGPGSSNRLPIDERGDLVPVPGENKLLCLSSKGYPEPGRLLGIDLQNKRIEWSYPNPFPGVHGSHRATMPKPGMLIGPLKICGVARVSDKVGSVFLMRGNLGQDFLMTTDGLYVGALFGDGRLPGDFLPATEAALLDRPMEHFTNGDEPFNGWFGKQADGKIRMTTGMPREAAMIQQVTGLETVRRFDGGTITLDAAMLAAAAADNASRAAAANGRTANQYVIKKMARPPGLDGNPAAWKEAQILTVAREGQPDSATVQLAYDDHNLYARFAVKDASPWRNTGKDYTRLFKTGDAVDIQLGLNPAAKSHTEPQAGDVRVVIAPLAGKPVAVLMAPVDKAAPPGARKTYNSGVGPKTFDRVAQLADTRIAVKVESDRYLVEAAISWQELGFVPQAGMTFHGDVGFISSDVQGLRNVARTYWASKDTTLVSDEPLEAWLFPATWGELVFE